MVPYTRIYSGRGIARNHETLRSLYPHSRNTSHGRLGHTTQIITAKSVNTVRSLTISR